MLRTEVHVEINNSKYVWCRDIEVVYIYTGQTSKAVRKNDTKYRKLVELLISSIPQEEVLELVFGYIPEESFLSKNESERFRFSFKKESMSGEA